MYAPWKSHPLFARHMANVNSLVDPVRCYLLWQFLDGCVTVPGAVAEFGVYKGGTALLMARLLGTSGKTLHLFDTFTGMPTTDPALDLHKAGDFADTSEAAVRKVVGWYPHAIFHVGFFPETAKDTESERFCFVHVDADIYRSVMDACSFFWSRLSLGGAIVFDDYGFESCPGAKRAVDEFFAGAMDRPWYLPSGQCVMVKRFA